jgi:hypothetical protein
VHRLAAVVAAEVDTADFTARVVAVEHRRASLARDPRVALSLTPSDNPFQPVIVRGRVLEWLEGDAAWAIVDQLAAKYIGQPYLRDEERVVAVIEPERQTVGLA